MFSSSVCGWSISTRLLVLGRFFFTTFLTGFFGCFIVLRLIFWFPLWKTTEENRLKMCKFPQPCSTLPKQKGPYHSGFLYLHTFFLIMCEISFAGSDDAFVGDAVDVSPPKPVDVPCKYIQIYTIMPCHLLWQCTYNNVNSFTIPVNVYH